MSEKVLYSVTTPCAEESMTVLEGLCETFLAESETLPAEYALSLRFAVAEGCKNALAQAAPRGRLAVATLSFLSSPSQTPRTCPAVEIKDPGEGLEIQGARPPYPPSHLGRDFVLARVLDQEVVAEVTGPMTVRLRIAQRDAGASASSRDEMLEQLDERGFGLLTLCKTWNQVLYEHSGGEGTKLRLEGPRLGKDAALKNA